ncbi:MAG: hypothetical protein ACI90V_011895, partial [Bacillariaceae sp.]|jgi:hypothetical protein
VEVPSDRLHTHIFKHAVAHLDKEQGVWNHKEHKGH